MIGWLFIKEMNSFVSEGYIVRLVVGWVMNYRGYLGIVWKLQGYHKRKKSFLKNKISKRNDDIFTTF